MGCFALKRRFIPPTCAVVWSVLMMCVRDLMQTGENGRSVLCNVQVVAVPFGETTSRRLSISG